MGNYITTYTRKHFDPINPDAELICIEDIAHALPMICRGNGHVSSFWSVGEHCILCAKEAAAKGYSNRLVLAALLHDASECYMSDVPRPLKQNMKKYKEYENHLLDVIYTKFLGFTLNIDEEKLIKEIDNALLWYDLKYLLDEESEELTDNFQRSRNTSLAFEQKMTPWTMSLNILYGIGIAAIFGLSIVLEQRGALPLAYVLGVLLFVFDLFGPLKALYGEASRLTVMNAALDRIEAVLNEPELPDTGKQHLPAHAQPGQPEVQFNDVVFAYQDKEVLHHISFAMKKDSMTALVGPSGSGKSTIANLLARLWDVKSGSIIIRGMDIRNVPLAELMEQISMVFQRVYLFQDTIYNNISIGKPDATEEEVYAAAKKARCYDFIMALPDGFQTVVGEGGATLSGGEKQRISIARCILKDAPIIILDEATASVDTDNESYIQEAISELVKGKTLLVIAHRLNTIQNADQILVIDNGQIAQQGTHEELLKQPGIYQEFVNIRKNAAGWSLA